MKRGFYFNVEHFIVTKVTPEGATLLEAISDLQFEQFARVILDNFGIYLKNDKKEMLQIRLYRLMTKYNVGSYSELLKILTRDQSSLADLADAITISKTNFFREINHFKFIQQNLESIMLKNARIRRNGELRVWSSACSTGEEPYTLAMVLKETLPPELVLKILGTDINRQNIAKAMRGVYSKDIANEVDSYNLGKYFKHCVEGYQVANDLQSVVTFRLFNLMEPFPFKHSFDFIFCRNVMIYFNNAIQQRLIDKFYEVLSPGGLLFIGHSESLTGKNHRFQYIQPTIYMK